MNCERCGQEVKECGHNVIWINNVPGGTHEGHLLCTYCGHNFGPVRELIEKAGKWDDIPTTSKVLQERIDLRAQVATLTRERDEAMSMQVRLSDANKTLFADRDEARKQRDEARGILKITTDQYDAMKKLADNAAKERDEANRWASHYTSLVITVRDERDAARARIAELEREKLPMSVTINANGTWEWRKV